MSFPTADDAHPGANFLVLGGSVSLMLGHHRPWSRMVKGRTTQRRQPVACLQAPDAVVPHLSAGQRHPTQAQPADDRPVKGDVNTMDASVSRSVRSASVNSSPCRQSSLDAVDSLFEVSPGIDFITPGS